MNTTPLSVHLRSLLRGRTVANVASAMGITRASLYEWYNGNAPPTPVNLRRYLRTLGLPVDHPPTWEAWLAYHQQLGAGQDAALSEVRPLDVVSS